jgi:hypothetical protein
MNRISNRMALAAALLSLFAVVVAQVGCGGRDGPERYSLSGSITMSDGKPVPAGEINFEPDHLAGNSGPGSMVQIKQGKYSLSADQGIVGGKYIVTISPFDGVAFGESIQGKPLSKAQHVEKIDLPSKNSTHDFKVTTK